MDIQTLLDNFTTHQIFSVNEILAIRTDQAFRQALVDHFRTNTNRPFAIALLNTFIKLRKHPENENYISMEDLMLASYILGLHKQVEDCLKVWEAKNVDFDSFCGVDIQLVPFAGVNETIVYLGKQTGLEADKALEYILECKKCGDFDDLEEYYQEGYPWFI